MFSYVHVELHRHSLPAIVVIPLCHLGSVHRIRSSVGRHVEGRDGVARHARNKARKVLYRLGHGRDAGGEGGRGAGKSCGGSVLIKSTCGIHVHPCMLQSLSNTVSLQYTSTKTGLHSEGGGGGAGIPPPLTEILKLRYSVVYS